VSGLNCEYLIVDIARHVGVHELAYFFYDFPYNVKFFLKVFMNVSALTFDLIESKVVLFDFFALLLARENFLSLI